MTLHPPRLLHSYSTFLLSLLCTEDDRQGTSVVRANSISLCTSRMHDYCTCILLLLLSYYGRRLHQRLAASLFCSTALKHFNWHRWNGGALYISHDSSKCSIGAGCKKESFGLTALYTKTTSSQLDTDWVICQVLCWDLTALHKQFWHLRFLRRLYLNPGYVLPIKWRMKWFYIYVKLLSVCMLLSIGFWIVCTVAEHCHYIKCCGIYSYVLTLFFLL